MFYLCLYSGIANIVTKTQERRDRNLLKYLLPQAVVDYKDEIVGLLDKM
jgi:hypothetical protein